MVEEYQMTWQEYCADQEEHDKAMNHYDEDGFCIYCADQFLTGNDAFIFSSSSKDQYSFQTGFPLGKIAGKDICLHWSAFTSD